MNMIKGSDCIGLAAKAGQEGLTSVFFNQTR